MPLTYRSAGPRRTAVLSAVLALVLSTLGATVALASHASRAEAATTQLHGVNWADPNDNFVTGPELLVGLTQSDSYSTVYSKATAVLKGFQNLGANTVRLPFNPATTGTSWWTSYQGAIDAATALGMNVVMAPWLQGGVIPANGAFYAEWDVVINKYLSKSNVYFDIMNEPYGYSAADEDNVAASWVAHYTNVPRGRIIVPGAYSDQNLCTVGADSRLNGTLLSIHDYTLGGETHPTEADWVTSFENNICGYASRTVMTEFGVPMNTGVNYDGARDGDNNVSYYYALTDTARNLGMGAILWTGVKEASQTSGPGPCFNASCAITTLNGSGTNLSVSVTNQSGLDRLHYAWGTSSGGGGGSTGVIRGSASNRCVDVPGASTTDGTQVTLYDCTGGSNQSYTLNSAKQLVVYGNKCLDAFGAGTAPGTKVIIYTCSSGTNQQWNLNSNGTITGVQSGLCLDASGQGTASVTLVGFWTCNARSNQKGKCSGEPPTAQLVARGSRRGAPRAAIDGCRVSSGRTRLHARRFPVARVR